MDIIKIIQDLNRQGSNVYQNLNNTYNALDRAVGGQLPYGEKAIQTTSVRKAGPQPFISGKDRFSEADRKSPITSYINEVPDKGLIPVPTINSTNEALLTAGKYAAGPLGMPFRPLRSPETSQRLQGQIDGASVRDEMLIHGLGEPNYQETRFPNNIQGGGIVGQFIGRPGLDNKVTVREPYDTRDMAWHGNKFIENIGKGDLINAGESVGNMAFRGLDDVGWANKYPRGTEQEIGELKPGHPYYRGGMAQSQYYRQ